MIDKIPEGISTPIWKDFLRQAYSYNKMYNTYGQQTNAMYGAHISFMQQAEQKVFKRIC